jgi:hypothetical protein
VDLGAVDVTKPSRCEAPSAWNRRPNRAKSTILIEPAGPLGGPAEVAALRRLVEPLRTRRVIQPSASTLIPSGLGSPCTDDGVCDMDKVRVDGACTWACGGGQR